jgi:PAS domain S-box-containing protein
MPLNYESLFRALPDPYIVIAVDDPDFTVIEESEAHAVMSMVRRQEVVGRPLFDVFPDMSEKYRKTGVSDLLESIRDVVRTGRPNDTSTMRYDLKDKHGMYVERYFKISHHPLFESTGPNMSRSKRQKVVAIVQVTADITEPTLSDQKLQRTERQLAEALDIAQVGTWMWDLVSDKIVADKNLSRMFGLTEQQGTTGLPVDAFMEAIHPDDRKRVRGEIAKSIKQRTLFDTEYRTVGRDGAVHWLLVRGRIETDASDKPIRFPGVLLDITERKRAELTRSFLVQASTALTSSLDYNKTLKTIARLAVPDIADWCVVDVLEDGVLHQVAVAHKDPKKVAWANDLRKKLGMNRLDDDTAVARVIRSGEPTFVPVIDEALLKRTSTTPDRLKLAKQLELSGMIAVPLIADKKVMGAITLILGGSNRHYNKSDLDMAVELANHASLAIANARLFDETRAELRKRVQLEEKLRQANDDLEQRVLDRTKKLKALNTDLNRSNQELQDFAYVASHDLQEPLRKIQAFGNLLEQEYADKLEEGADYLHRMQKAAARMSSLITDLLSFSRVTSKVQEFVPVDLKVIALEVVEDLYARVSDTKGTVRIASLPTINADPLQMRQLLQNLIGNALKFHKPEVPPEVTVSATTVTKDGQHYVQLSVSDNGVGFDQKYVDRIFAVFQRLHGRDAYEGTGIGLAVCRKIVERHHGTITAKSRPDKGAVFLIRLPVGQGLAQKVSHMDTAGQHGGHDRYDTVQGKIHGHRNNVEDTSSNKKAKGLPHE